MKFGSNEIKSHSKKNDSMKKAYPVILFFTWLTGVCCAQETIQNNFEDWSSKPPIVKAFGNNLPPSDALVLFSDNFDLWTFSDNSEVTWPISEKAFKVVPGTQDIKTKKAFGSCQLHVEWRVPTDEEHGENLDWGNSGVKLMGLYEVQIYDSFNDTHRIYYNGQAGSLYKQQSPLVNCCNKPGDWEIYDIIFTAPEFNNNGTVKSPAYFTVLHNGVLIQNHAEIRGTTVHSEYTEYEQHPEKLPLSIQCHGSGVEYRNIWIREL
jgi:hypothetical protein